MVGLVRRYVVHGLIWGRGTATAGVSQRRRHTAAAVSAATTAGGRGAEAAVVAVGTLRLTAHPKKGTDLNLLIKMAALIPSSYLVIDHFATPPRGCSTAKAFTHLLPLYRYSWVRYRI